MIQFNALWDIFLLFLRKKFSNQPAFCKVGAKSIVIHFYLMVVHVNICFSLSNVLHLAF